MNFSMGQLEVIYARLLDTDLTIKTGRMEDILALDTLVAALCGPGD
jgi:DNA polymerase III delta subunit